MTFLAGHRHMLWNWRKKPAGSPERALDLRKRGSRLLAQKRFHESINLLRQAAEIEPHNFDGRVNLGSACYLTGQHEEAIGHFRYVLGIDPYHPMALLNLAAAFDAVGKLEESIRTLEQLRHARPKFPDVHYNLAIAYMKQEDYAKAEQMLKEELQLNPKNQNARSLLNKLYLKIPKRSHGTQ
ncbi:MAG: hypothetical protein COS85_17385 [Armatimonadetes bacterium CG07_land_8_20_14_0_80_59_28]|nr:MAG: hypothetical protein COS85_17385 [Armatimonadetes bacterium CG07_land_8_20_14_0_80_59_28]